MGLPILPDEVLLPLLDRWPCREAQLRRLALLLHPGADSAPNLIIYGSQATGKSAILRDYLDTAQHRFVVIPCQECVTGRHFLERVVNAIRDELAQIQNGDGVDPSGPCENLSSLAAHLSRLLSALKDKFVLVLDGIDSLRDAPPTLLPALARLHETIPNLINIFIVRHPAPSFLHLKGTPHLHFTPYTRTQAIHIVSRQPPDIFIDAPDEGAGYDDEVHQEDKAWLWPRFCAAVWDALAEHAARDLMAFSDLCHDLWRPFVAPIIKGDYGTRDFTRLLVHQRRLFQEESMLLTSIIATSEPSSSIQQSHELPYYAKWLLVAAYLASFNPAKVDALFFMKSTERKRRKKGGGVARSGGRPSQNRKIPRHLLAPSAFTIDRLLAILHAILPEELRTTIDLYKQIAISLSLRLLVRSSGLGSTDVLEAGAKLRVGPAVTLEYAQSMARSLDFIFDDYLFE